MTGHHESPHRFLLHRRARVTWPVPHDRWLTWPETDICIVLQLHRPCLSCVKAVRANHPSSDSPLLAFLRRRCHYWLHMAATRTSVTLLSLCIQRPGRSLSPLPALSFSVTTRFFCHFILFLSLFTCPCPSVGIISYVAIKGKCWCWHPE